MPQDGLATADGWVLFDSARLAGPDRYDRPRALYLLPFGTGTDGQTFTLRVTLYFAAGVGAAGRLYVPSPAVECLCTLGDVVGLGGKELTDTDRLCKTIADSAAGLGTKGTDYAVLSSGAARGAASLVVAVRGAAAARVQVGTAATAAAGNALAGIAGRAAV